MKTVAIVVDNWKLPIFRRTLDAEGYEYSEHGGPDNRYTALKVETGSIAKLKKVAERMMDEAEKSKRR